MPDLYTRNLFENFHDEGQELATAFINVTGQTQIVAAKATKRIKVLGIALIVLGPGSGVTEVGFGVGGSATTYWRVHAPSTGIHNESYFFNFQPSGWVLAPNTALHLKRVSAVGTVEATVWYRYVD